MNAPLKILSKLLLINIFSIILVLLTVYAAFHLLASGYFVALTEKYHIAPEDAHVMFMAAVDRYLLLASLTGLIFASVMSLWLSYRLTRPIMYIQQAASRISAGDYDHTLIADACGEFEQLSRSFNTMAKRLQQIDRMRKEFIVDIAHELRTPLTNIRGYTEGLRDGIITPDNNAFDSIHEESLRLVRLVEDLLVLARADIATQDLDVKNIDYNHLIQQTVFTFQPKLKEHHLSIEYLFSKPLYVMADQQRVNQILNNLLENAIRYASHNSTITISIQLDQQGSFVKTEIINALEEDNIQLTDQLFERFHRGETSRSRDYGGAGLGLAIVKRLVEAHGGTVGIHSHERKAVVWYLLPTR